MVRREEEKLGPSEGIVIWIPQLGRVVMGAVGRKSAFLMLGR